MIKSIQATEYIWFIAYTNSNAYVTGEILAGQEVSTSESLLEQFNTEESFLTRCNELNITPNHNLVNNTNEDDS